MEREKERKKGRKTKINDTVKARIYKYVYIIHELRKERNKVLVENELNSYKNEQLTKKGSMRVSNNEILT
jgi:hypothetical protein